VVALSSTMHVGEGDGPPDELPPHASAARRLAALKPVAIRRAAIPRF
jgi:hypothetical protein